MDANISNTVTKPKLDAPGAAAVVCVSCGSGATRQLGEIPPSRVFAGRTLDRSLPGGHLWRCDDCQLLFRHPRPGKAELDDLYRQGHSEGWFDEGRDRADWILTQQILAAYPAIKRVLDIGCFDGRLLDSLGPGYQKLGVEIHAEAAARAQARGVQIVGEDFGALRAELDSVDAVLAMDVIEHTEDPRAFLAELAQVVKPGGLILIGTGNTDAPSWRFMGSAYWYCHVAEHISFINPRWADRAARSLGLEKVAAHRFSHRGEQLGRSVREAVLNILYRLSPALFAWLRGLGAGGIDVTRFQELRKVPPYWLSARDHVLIVLRKNEN